MPDKEIVEKSSPTSSSKKSFAPVSQVLRQAWEIVKLSWKNLLLLTLIIWGISAVLVLVAGGAVVGSAMMSMNSGSIFTGTTFAAIGFAVLIGIVVLIASSVFGTGMMIAVAEYKERPSIGSLIKRGLGLFLPVFLTSLIMMFLIYGGFFLLVIPGIAIAILTGFSIYEVIFTENRYMAAIKNSVRIVGQNFGELFIRVLVVLGLVIGLAIVQGILQGIVGEDSAAMPLISLVMGIVQMLFGWFAMAYYYLVYKEARSMTDFNKKASTMWMWIVSVLGWIAGGFLIVAASTFIRTMMQDPSFNDKFAPAMMDENYETMYDGQGGESMDADQLLEEYGQEMTEEEKAMFKQIMEQSEANMQQDENAATQESL